MSDDESYEEKFRRMGPGRVRLMLDSDSFSITAKQEAIHWLAHLAEEDRLRSDVSQASQIRIALSARNAAWVAAIAAIIAAVAAIITIVVELKK